MAVALKQRSHFGDQSKSKKKGRRQEREERGQRGSARDAFDTSVNEERAPSSPQKPEIRAVPPAPPLQNDALAHKLIKACADYRRELAGEKVEGGLNAYGIIDDCMIEISARYEKNAALKGDRYLGPIIAVTEKIMKTAQPNQIAHVLRDIVLPPPAAPAAPAVRTP